MDKRINHALRQAVTAFCVVTVFLANGSPPAHADGKSKLAQEAADYVLQRFGRQVASESIGTLASKIESYAVRHGDGFYAAVRKVGPTAFRLVEEAGEHAPQVVGILSRFGEDGAVWVIARPRGMQLFLEHGEAAAAVLAKTHGVAEPVMATLGKPAVQAFESLANGQNARRLAMMASEGGELAAAGKAPEVLGVVAKYGDPAMEFLWKHKEVLASGAVLTTFVANPEPFITGAKDITQVVAANTLKPLAEAPGAVAGEIAKATNWTFILGLVVIALGVWAALQSWRKARSAVHPDTTGVKWR